MCENGTAPFIQNRNYNSSSQYKSIDHKILKIIRQIDKYVNHQQRIII